jgi:CelD/BcsL family acetyltransferase involved in cellulose biosynthesis
MSGTVTIQHATSLLEVEVAWKDLHARNGAAVMLPPPFDWFLAWERAHPCFVPRIVVATRDGRTVGILPLAGWRRRALRLLPVTELRFIGHGLTDTCGLLVDPEIPGVADALLEAVERDASWDALHLTEIPHTAPGLSAWSGFAKRVGGEWRRRVACPVLPIGRDDSEEELFARLSGGLRQNLRTDRNRARREGREIVFRCSRRISPEELSTALELHAERQGGPGLVQGARDFLFEFFADNPSGDAYFATLAEGGELLAYALGWTGPRVVSFWNTAFRPDPQKLALGKWLIRELVGWAREQGYAYFDFGRGAEAYKLQWTKQCVYNHEIVCDRSLKARALRRARRLVGRETTYEDPAHPDLQALDAEKRGTTIETVTVEA